MTSVSTDGESTGSAVEEPTPRATGGRTSSRRRLPTSGASAALMLIQLGPAVVLGLMWIAMAIASPFFLTSLNVSNVLQACAITAILAVGQLVVMLTGEIDLSAGAVLVVAMVVGGKVAEAGADGLVVVLAMLGIGVVAGIVNGLLIEWVRLGSSFIVTLGTLGIATGLSYVISRGSTYLGFPDLVTTLGGGKTGGVPTSTFVVAAFALAVVVLTTRLRWGRWIYAIGGNREAAVRVGIPVRAVTMSVFVISGLAAGLAGVVSAGFTDSASPAVGFTAQLDAISAVIIGGAALFGGRGTVIGALVGALILATIHNGITLLHVDGSWEPIVLGTVLLVAVGLDKVRNRFELHLRILDARRQGDLAPTGAEASA